MWKMRVVLDDSRKVHNNGEQPPASRPKLGSASDNMGTRETYAAA